MKKTIFIFAMALGLVACSQEELPKQQEQNKPSLEQTQTMTITASIADSKLTKTALSGNDTDGYDVVWSEGDKIKIGSETFTLSEGAGTTSGKFTGTTLADGDYVAYYATSDGQVPFTQTYTAGKIANSPMQAQVTVTGGEASIANFTNIGGLLHLTIKKVKAATIKSIVLNVTLNSSDSRMILDCESSPVTLTEAGSEFYIAMPAGTFTKVSVDLITTSGETLTKKLSASKSLVITRSQITNASFKTNTLNGHEFVDLGLPSGLLWATCNIGTTDPEEVGTYFAWGETKGKEISEYTWKSYAYGTDTELTKYCKYESHGTVDNLTELDPSDDAACQRWGDGWRMPTAAEYQELIDNCYWEWVYHFYDGYSGPDGWIVYKAKNNADKGKMCDSNGTGKINGYSRSDTHIFFPISGRIVDGELQAATSGDCYYWTSTLSTGWSPSAQDFAGYSLGRKIDTYARSTGMPIRAVCE